MPVSSRIPNPAAISSNGTDNHTVRPSVRGPPTRYPRKPAPPARPAPSVGMPEAMCHRPSAGRATSIDPRTSRGRISGRGSVRMRTTAITRPVSGSTALAPPTSARTAASIQPPSGPPTANQTLPATTTLAAMSPRAMPSRRWPCSTSVTLPTVRVVAPTPRAIIVQPCRSRGRASAGRPAVMNERAPCAGGRRCCEPGVVRRVAGGSSWRACGCCPSPATRPRPRTSRAPPTSTVRSSTTIRGHPTFLPYPSG